MEVVAVLDVSAERPGDVLERLASLGHRCISRSVRRYSFPGGEVARAFGESEEIVAILPTRVFACDGAVVYAEKTAPVPYLPWSRAVVDGDEVVRDYLVTHRARVRVTRPRGGEDADGGEDAVASARVVVGDDLCGDLRAVRDVLSVVGADVRRFDEAAKRVIGFVASPGPTRGAASSRSVPPR